MTFHASLCKVLRMRFRRLFLFYVLAAYSIPTLAEDLTGKVKKAIERSTLNQPGTKPFHLKATLAPSFERDRDSGRTGEVEIWWVSPNQWKREVRSPDFHQAEVMDAGKDWRKNEGDYFPEWLRETAVALINPVPNINEVLARVKNGEAKRFGGRTKTGQLIQQVTIDWTATTGTAEVRNIQRSWVAFDENSGLLLYGGGFGWGAEFKDYQNFHGRMVARTVNVGSPQVTAKVTVLEDLGQPQAGFFQAGEGAGSQPLNTLLLDEVSLRKNLPSLPAVEWPTVQDGALQGNVTTWILIDREEKVREIDGIVCENAAMNDTGKEAVMHLQFKPFVANGAPVQAYSQFTLPFKTTRPAGTEKFESAQTYFERARKSGFPAAGAAPYILHAEFELKSKTGELEKGRYEDTWLSDRQWRREAWFDDSHFVRSRNNEKRYRVSEGQSAGLLAMLLRMLEPIPALDTFQESDWRIKHDTLNGTQTIRVLTGYESPDGKLDPVQVRGFWFDNDGLLLRTHFKGIETQRSDFLAFGEAKIACQIDVLKDGSLLMRIHVTEVTAAQDFPESKFKLPGHDWERQFTDEVR